MKKNNLLQGIVQKLLLISPFVFPLYLLHFQLFGIPMTVLEVFCYLIFSLWLLAIILRHIPVNWQKPLRYYWILAFVLIIGATIGVLTAPHYINLPSGEVLDAQRTALGVWKGWIIAPILYFVVLTQSITSSVDLKKLLRSFVYAGALVALISYGYAILDSGITYDFRLSGFYESANYLSLFLVPPLLISVYFLFQRRGKPEIADYLDVSSLAIMAHALFFTQSYAAIIGVFGSIGLYVLYLIIWKTKKKKAALIAFGLLVLTFSIVLLTQINTPKFKQFLDWENRSSTSVRLEVYEIAWGLINEEPLTGIGPGLFQAEYQTRGRENLGHVPMEWNIPHPHNIFFAFWLNAGLLGLSVLILFLILVHRKFTYPLIAFWGIIIHGIFDTPFWKNDLSMIFWLILGSIVILQTYGTDTPKKRTGPIRKRLNPKVVRRPEL
ncbi:O-antigen ligase family protein [Candidatus Peregrinibacteria bacterium]|nr:O-antigen ligase family protein [Candidatus Peregrinibacteria bacterium]